MFHRSIKLNKNNSFFLFGPRGTGKSTLLKGVFQPPEALYIDLLDAEWEEQLRRRPQELIEIVTGLAAQSLNTSWIIIDEVQKIPKLLDVVHSAIESTAIRFALTGSSARKLKHGGGNLLAGRAFMYALFPLTHRELGDQFDLLQVLQWGSLPKLLQLQDISEKQAFLRAYATTYLKEEIQLEQVVRKLDPFRNFLGVAAQCNGQILNFSKIAVDIGVDTKTVQSYFSILSDTLIGFLLEPYHQSIRKRQRTNPKFYFFDTGVKCALERTLTLPLQQGTYAFGKSFEHWLLIEMIRLHAYQPKDYQFSYLRTKDDAEIDLVIERPGIPLALVEIKSTDRITPADTKNLERFTRDIPHAEGFCLSRTNISKKIGPVWVLPWQQGLVELGF